MKASLVEVALNHSGDLDVYIHNVSEQHFENLLLVDFVVSLDLGELDDGLGSTLFLLGSVHLVLFLSEGLLVPLLLLDTKFGQVLLGELLDALESVGPTQMSNEVGLMELTSPSEQL